MLKIDITTTATLRPELLEKTLDSFWENLFQNHTEIDFRLVINIDPIGQVESYPGCMQTIYTHMCNYCFSIFPNSLINFPEKANFAKAFKWCWGNVRPDADFVFHLEDDWQLLRQVDLTQMIFLTEKYPRLIILRLNAFTSKECTTKNWNLLLNWNGDFFEVSQSLKGTVGFCGHPSLINAGFVRGAAKYLDGIHNPEKVMKGRHPHFGPILHSAELGVFSEQNSLQQIKDLGRKWMIRNNYRKWGSKAFFTEWRKV